METASSPPPTTVDDGEIAKFSAIASQWWDPDGKFRPLHRFNPVRLAYIRDRAGAHFGRGARDRRPFEGLRLLDIGCGGGLLCEPMTRLGAEVVGADASQTNIGVARLHAREMGLDIDYRATRAEDLADAGETFDIVLNMEVVEHVSDLGLFMASCTRMVRPGGLIFSATLNRTFKSFALAIVGAEYVLGWLPRGTHQWEKFVTPDELRATLDTAGLPVVDTRGVVYNPLADTWRLSADTDVNYMILAARQP